MQSGPAYIFVTHRMTGVRRIPALWLDGFSPSGFRLATPDEIREGHDERGLRPPEGSAQVEHLGGTTSHHHRR